VASIYSLEQIMIQEGSLLWTPSPEVIEQANLTHYMRWLGQRGVKVDSYLELWQWSVENIANFWESLWDYFDLKYIGRFSR
jgi:acetoacetyl-CoA synthetase